MAQRAGGMQGKGHPSSRFSERPSGAPRALGVPHRSQMVGLARRRRPKLQARSAVSRAEADLFEFDVLIHKGGQSAKVRRHEERAIPSAGFPTGAATNPLNPPTKRVPSPATKSPRHHPSPSESIGFAPSQWIFASRLPPRGLRQSTSHLPLRAVSLSELESRPLGWDSKRLPPLPPATICENSSSSE